MDGRKRKRLLALGALLLLLAAAWGGWCALHPAPPLTLYGNVDIRLVSLGFRVAGRLQSLAFDEGDRVAAGAVLARLDAEPYQHNLAEAEANEAALRARLALMNAGYRPEEVAQAAANVAQRQAQLTDAEATLTRQQALRGSGAVAAHAYDDALALRDQARAQWAAAQAQYAQYRHGYRAEERAQAQAQWRQAQAVLANARLQLADTQLKAPQGGIVLTRAAEPGTILSAGAPLFTLSLQAPVWVRAYVAEPDLGLVPPGTAVLVWSDSRPTHAYQGVVGYVSPSAEFTPKNVETPDLRTGLVYRLRVVIRDADSALRQGMPVTVRLAGHR